MDLYHVVTINVKTGNKVIMTRYPCTHKEACTILGKLTRYSWRRNEVERVEPQD